MIRYAVVFVVFCFLTSLGFWQLNRAEEKRQLIAEMKRGQAAKVVDMSAVKDPNKIANFKLVSISGRFDNKHTFLIDNKFRNHRAGYGVVTPFILKGHKTLLLVNRGWFPMGTSRSIMPKIPVIKGEKTLVGIVYKPSKHRMLLGTNITSMSEWPMVMQRLDYTSMAALLKQNVYKFIVLLDDKGAEPGFIRRWKIINMPPERHVGYAVQWFTCAGVLLLLFMWLLWTERKQKNESE